MAAARASERWTLRAGSAYPVIVETVTLEGSPPGEPSCPTERPVGSIRGRATVSVRNLLSYQVPVGPPIGTRG